MSDRYIRSVAANRYFIEWVRAKLDLEPLYEEDKPFARDVAIMVRLAMFEGPSDVGDVPEHPIFPKRGRNFASTRRTP